MKKVFLLLTIGLTMASCNKEAIEGLEADVDLLQTTINNLTAQITENANDIAATDAALTTSIETANQNLIDLNNLISGLNASDVELQTEIDNLSDDATLLEEAIAANLASIESLDIPSIEGLATEDDLEDIADDLDAIQGTVETLGADALALTATVDSLSIDLTDLATDVAAIDPTEAVVSDWLPAFGVQSSTFDQIQTTSIVGIEVGSASRTIEVTPSEIPVTSTVTATVGSFITLPEELNGLSLGDDVIVSQTTTSTLYTFRLDAVKVHEHTIDIVGDWKE